MTAAKKLQPISVDDYLAAEANSTVKHEYYAGHVYAMAGANNRHVLISSNAFGSLFNRLRGKPCRALNSDSKVRIRLSNQTRFYYPDTSVVCQPNEDLESFQDFPKLIVEVISPSTRRIDEREKLDAYLTIQSVSVVLLVEQDAPLVVAYRRTTDGFAREIHDGLHAAIPLAEIDAELPLAELYDRVEFPAEPDVETW